MHRRIWGSISRRPSRESEKAIPNGDSPEASVARGVRLFCESGGPNNSGEEVLHLPVIVEAAESSPAAATEASTRIRKFLSKENHQRAYVQYNAIMLVRILADNPGKTFTRNLDQKFVNTVKELLRDGKDMSVQQILRETLDNFETNKANDETLALLLDMWIKEKAKITKRGGRLDGGPAVQPSIMPPQYNPNQQNYFARNHRPRGLPPPAELAQRIEEARISAKLLSQVVQSTPPVEVLGNELIKEFVERCQSASRSVQSYIHSDSPPPDEDTLLTLIETNDQLATALSRHQRAMLQARRAAGTPSPNPPPAQSGPYEAPANPPAGPPMGFPSNATRGSTSKNQKSSSDEQNPFGDHNESDRSEDYTQQTPLAPQYGMPPANTGKETRAMGQLGVYRSGYQGGTSYGNRQAATTNDTNMHRGDAEDETEEEEVRKPVQYRF
ncbi:hypothetical protein N7G274_008601 [Stereocaulon virgatum]|uniref:GAT domain-containing protein n=1 Tax=Stereocaulon virgatum TaxID=373712 RepID=A0ABR4A1B0_9LECA